MSFPRAPSRPTTFLVFAFLASALVAGLSGPAAALGERVFEANTVTSTEYLEVYSGQSVAQSFLATETYRLLNLTLRLRNTGDTSDSIDVSIRPDESGRPSNVRMASASIEVGHNNLVTVAVPFPDPPSLTSGERYWIVATSSSSLFNAYRWYHSDSNAYGNGRAMENIGGGWSEPFPATDMYFVTYGRTIEANVTAAMRTDRPVADPGDVVTFRVYLNNSGETVVPTVWLNDTELPGLTYVSDTAADAGSTTEWPSFTFLDVGNGARSFDLLVRVDIGTEPGTVLERSLALVYREADGTIGSGPEADATILVGVRHKQLYLDPAAVGSSSRLDPARPNGGAGSQVNRTIVRGNTITFDQDPALGRPFRTTRAGATLFIDSQNHEPETLVVNLTLSEWNGVTLTPVVDVQRTIATNGFNDYESFAFTFPAFDHTFSTGSRVRLDLWLRGTSTRDAVLAMNSTFAASAVDLETTSYVRIDRIDLLDEKGPATVWSPKDSLVVQANVSDPFGSREISGAWVNVTSPSGDFVVNQTAMALFATDPATPSTWKVFRFSLPSPLDQGLYAIDVRAVEANGVQDVEEGSALVRAPAFSLEQAATKGNVQGGDVYAYRIWYNNTGSGPAGRVWINDSLPAEVLFQGSSEPGAMTGDYNWTWPSREVGNYALTIDVEVRAGLPPIPYFRNSVFLNYTDEKGFSWPMKVASVDVAYRGPVIALTKASNKTVLHPNEAIVYTIQLQNTGEAAGTIWVNDTLPSGLAYVSTTADGTVTVSDNLVYITFAGMPALSTRTFTITAVAGPDLLVGDLLPNRVTVNYTNSNGFLLPPRTASWNVLVSAPVIASAAVSIERTQATPDEILRATIGFVVGGTEAARDVWVNLTLDWALQFVNATEVADVSGTGVRFLLANVGLGPRAIALNLSVAGNVTDHHLMSVAGTLTYTDAVRNVGGTIALDPDRVEASAPRVILDVNPKESTVEAGSLVYLTVYQSNAGSGVAADVWLSLRLPGGFSGARTASGDSDANLTIAGLLYTWHWEDVAPGVRSFPLELTVRPTVLNGTRANLQFHTDYTDVKGNFRTGETESVFVNFIAPQVDMVVTPSGTQARVGENIGLQLSLRNTGGTSARKIWVEYRYDSHAEVVTYTGLPSRELWGLNWSFTDVQPGREVTIGLTIRIREGTPARFIVPADFAATYTNGADLVIESKGIRATIAVAEDPTPLIATAAASAGVGTLGILVAVRRLSTKIEEVFLVYRDGVLLYHLSRSLSSDKDEDVLSGMLTAVQEFVRDAFVYGEHRELHHLDFGDYRIMIERGRNLYLAVVYSGKGMSAVRARVRTVLDHIERAYGSVLAKWDGDMEKVAGARDLIREYLLKPAGRSSRGLPDPP